MTSTPTPAAIEARFREWWSLSFAVPPAPHTVRSHVAFTEWMLAQCPTTTPSPEPTSHD